MYDTRIYLLYQRLAGGRIMTRKIFKSIFMASIITLFVTFATIIACMYPYFGNMEEKQLIGELGIAARGTEVAGEDFLTKLKSKQYRVTWIDKDGTVLFDNHLEATKMKSHADREEIKEALKDGRGSSKRYSTTLTEKTIYKAQKLSDGTVLRISVSHKTIIMLLWGMVQLILWIIVFAVVLSGILASKMAKKIVEPLSGLDLEEPLSNNTYEELSPLLKRIDTLHKSIVKNKKD